MGSLIDELQRREAAAREEAEDLRGQIARLGERLALVEERLSRLVITVEFWREEHLRCHPERAGTVFAAKIITEELAGVLRVRQVLSAEAAPRAGPGADLVSWVPA
jgi:hypothetical protein